jgi:hypothetical protein
MVFGMEILALSDDAVPVSVLWEATSYIAAKSSTTRLWPSSIRSRCDHGLRRKRPDRRRARDHLLVLRLGDRGLRHGPDDVGRRPPLSAVASRHDGRPALRPVAADGTALRRLRNGQTAVTDEPRPAGRTEVMNMAKIATSNANASKIIGYLR